MATLVYENARGVKTTIIVDNCLVHRLDNCLSVDVLKKKFWTARLKPHSREKRVGLARHLFSLPPGWAAIRISGAPNDFRKANFFLRPPTASRMVRAYRVTPAYKLFPKSKSADFRQGKFRPAQPVSA